MTNPERESAEEFGSLPTALVERLVEQSEALGEVVTKSLESVAQIRDATRTRLSEDGLLTSVNKLPNVEDPTTCGVDGSYIVEPLVGYDLVVVAGLATEGLTPPSETRFWEQPHFTSFINAEPHLDDNKSYARALMMCYELAHAAKAPHDVVLLDGSFISPITSLHQALTKTTFSAHKSKGNKSLVSRLKKALPDAIRNYHRILNSGHSDTSWVAIPKYTSKREMGSRLNIPEQYDDRALCTLILDPGEFAGPFPMEDPTARGWAGYQLNRDHIHGLDMEIDNIESILTHSVYILYYRPSPSTPALRIEVPKRTATDQDRLSLVIQAIRSQSQIPGLLEPQPLHYADQMAKSVSAAVPAIKEMISRFSSREYSGSVNDVFFILHGYRTEGE